MWTALWIFIGGGLGSVARWVAASFVGNRFGQTFPWGTLVVNVFGSFLIGLFVATTGPSGRWVAPDTVRQFVIVGMFGGFTTFSAFSLQTLQLAQAGAWGRAGANCLLSLVLCLGGVWLGHWLGLHLNSSSTT